MSKLSLLILAHVAALSLIAVVFNGMANFLDITDAMAFYGVYHRNPINQIIHFFGVPCIIWSLLVFLCHLHVPFLRYIKIDLPLAPTHGLNYATILTIAYLIFYLKMDLFGGSLYAPFAYLQYVTAVRATMGSTNMQEKSSDKIISKKYDNKVERSKERRHSGTGKSSLKLALFIHFLGWYVQIHPGHAIYEGAKPAVTASVGGAITCAPLFAYYEGLWYLGFNKELQRKTIALVDVYTDDLCQNGAQMRVCDEYNNAAFGQE